MWQKISDFQFKAYFAFSRFIQDLKDDERGLSGVVVAVLLILVAVLAIILLWKLLGKSINDWWKQITGAEGAGGLKEIPPAGGT